MADKSHDNASTQRGSPVCLQERLPSGKDLGLQPRQRSSRARLPVPAGSYCTGFTCPKAHHRLNRGSLATEIPSKPDGRHPFGQGLAHPQEWSLPN